METMEMRSYLNEIKQLTGQSKIGLCVVGRNWCIRIKTMFLLAAGEMERNMQRESFPGSGPVADKSQGGTVPSHWGNLSVSSHIRRSHRPQQGFWMSLVSPCPSANRERGCCSSHTGERSSPWNGSISHSELCSSHPGMFLSLFWIWQCGLASPSSWLWALTRLRFPP